MAAKVTKVVGVRPLGDNLSVVRVEGIEHEVVANRREDGSFRWAVNQPVVYVPEGMVVPDDVLRERGYWDEEKGKGLLEGKKGNRVKMRRFGPEEDRVESRGLLFFVDSKIVPTEDDTDEQGEENALVITRAGDHQVVEEGSDVSDFLGLIPHSA